jgi:hypothetical protein
MNDAAEVRKAARKPNGKFRAQGQNVAEVTVLGRVKSFIEL